MGVVGALVADDVHQNRLVHGGVLLALPDAEGGVYFFSTPSMELSTRASWVKMMRLRGVPQQNQCRGWRVHRLQPHPAAAS